MKKNDNTIFETFIKLTSRTYPYGTEDELVSDMIEQGIFPSDLQKDTHGNYFYKIGESRTIFASHLDTVSKDATSVIHTFDGDIIGTDGKTTNSVTADTYKNAQDMLNNYRNTNNNVNIDPKGYLNNILNLFGNLLGSTALNPKSLFGQKLYIFRKKLNQI
jgi:hypothetical protein